MEIREIYAGGVGKRLLLPRPLDAIKGKESSRLCVTKMLKLPQLLLSPKAWRAELFLFSSLSWKEEENVEVDECDEEKDELEEVRGGRGGGEESSSCKIHLKLLSLFLCLLCVP